MTSDSRICAIGRPLFANTRMILIANVQHPVGARFNPDTMRMEVTDFMAVMFNPVAQAKFVHTVDRLKAIRGAFGLSGDDSPSCPSGGNGARDRIRGCAGRADSARRLQAYRTAPLPTTTYAIDTAIPITDMAIADSNYAHRSRIQPNARTHYACRGIADVCAIDDCGGGGAHGQPGQC